MKILQIGAGGIGSYLIEFVSKAYSAEQITTDIEYYLADGDTVELKNISYQNFELKDIGKFKVDCLAKRYEDHCYVLPLNKFIVDLKDMNKYDMIVLAVDNSEIRNKVFKYCHAAKKMFIDLRAEGRMVFAMSMGDTLKDDMNLLDVRDTEHGSCQLKHDLDNNTIQYGNLIVASMGIQLIVNYLRTGKKGQRILLNV